MEDQLQQILEQIQNLGKHVDTKFQQQQKQQEKNFQQLQMHIGKCVPSAASKAPKAAAIEISDANVSEYATRFETIQPVSVAVIIMGNPFKIPRLEEVLRKIDQNAIDVASLIFEYLYKYSVDIAENNEILLIIENILKRCEVEVYVGPVTDQFTFKEAMERLSVSLSDYNSLHRFQTQLRDRERRFEFLAIRVFLSIEEPRIEDILPLRGDIAGKLLLQIPDVTSPADAAKAALILRHLLPITGDKSFTTIDFPRCQMKDDIEITNLLLSLKGIKVKENIYFPSSSRPSSDKRKDPFETLAKDATGCNGIIWRDDFDFLW